MKPLMLKVETYDPLTEETIGTKEIDYNNIEQRKWYISNFIWAMTNGKAIDCMPLNMPMKLLMKTE